MDANSALISVLFRSVLYLWLASEFLFLSHLYAYGYTKYRKTPIIITLQRLFLSIGVFFSVVAFLPILRLYTDEGYAVFLGFLPFFIIPLGLLARKFRSESIKETKLPLPKKKKDIDGVLK